MIKKPIFSILIVAFLVAADFVNANAFDTEYSEVTVPATILRDFHSDIINRDYRLSISLPEGYSENTDKQYPVLYILDGNMYFATAVQSYRVQRLGNDVPEMIIVGVEYPTRRTDEWLVRRAGELTPTKRTDFDENYTKQYNIPSTSGDADTFLKVMGSEIVPFVAKNYRASDDRALFGHSLGGLFATYSLLQKDRLFNRYIISSPSLWWDDEVAFKHEAKFYETSKTIDAKVMLSVGALEGQQMVPPMQRMSDILNARSYKGFTLVSHIFPNETHLSVQPGTLSRGLRVVFDTE
jgi:predicted alpha/beta superfamily hydrolase